MAQAQGVQKRQNKPRSLTPLGFHGLSRGSPHVIARANHIRRAAHSPFLRPGEVAEWLKAPHSKCGIGASLSGVRIPPSPPLVPIFFWLFEASLAKASLRAKFLISVPFRDNFTAKPVAFLQRSAILGVKRPLLPSNRAVCQPFGLVFRGPS